MLAILAAILSLPPPEDIQRFPPCFKAQEQLERCLRHEERLRTLEGIRGWEGGRWQRVREETAQRRRYWQCLIECHDCWGSEWWCRWQLARLYREVADCHRWAAGWHPVEIPDNSRFDLFPTMPFARP